MIASDIARYRVLHYASFLKPANLGKQCRNDVIGVLTQHAFLGCLERYFSRGRNDRAILAAGRGIPEKMDPHIVLSSKSVEDAFAVPRIGLKCRSAKRLRHDARESLVYLRA